MKYFNFKRYKFSTIVKGINNIRYNFFKFIDLRGHDFKKFYKYLNIRKFDVSKITKFLNFRKYNTARLKYNIVRLKRIDFISRKFFLFHLPASIIFFSLLYLIIPSFYSYDKSTIENSFCKNNNVQCTIRGSVKYRFYPTPRLKIKDLVINEQGKKKNPLISADNVSIKLSVKNLLAKEKHKFNKVEINNFDSRIDLKKIKKFNNFLKKSIDLVPITFQKGQIVFFEENSYVAKIDDAEINLKFANNSTKVELNGKFLNDNIYIYLNKNFLDEEENLAEIILKMSNFKLLSKINFFNSKKDKKILSGNILLKKDKYRFTSLFDFENDELIITKSNLRNPFLDGKLEGKVTILPYFKFDMDLSLNSINFTKLYNYFLSLNEKDQKNFFKINNKINGKLNFSTEKVYSKHNLIKSFESRIKFHNGNIKIDQFLINLGKLGAADLLGAIENDKKISKFKFESNIFVDNQKKFLSKFGIYNKENISSNLFISANFDLDNIRTSFYEISGEKKFNNEDVNYIEQEFNDLMLDDGYTYLFDFPHFKNFLKSVISEKN